MRPVRQQALLQRITRRMSKNGQFPNKFGKGRRLKSELPPHARPLHPQVGIGHVHLKVADLDRALAIYRDVLGFELTQRYGSQAAFLSAGGYHHHIGLNTWESSGGSLPPARTTGLYHLAILYPTRTELADALRRLIGAGFRSKGRPIMA
jgi:catechol 2,3-dioxygenase